MCYHLVSISETSTEPGFMTKNWFCEPLFQVANCSLAFEECMHLIAKKYSSDCGLKLNC